MNGQNVTAVILGLLAMLGGGGVTWLGVRRKSSGKINTTEAEVLWSESQKMRQELRDQVADMRVNMAAMRTENDRLQTELADAHTRAAQFSIKLSECQQKVVDYEGEINRLMEKLPVEKRKFETTITHVRAENAALKTQRKKR